MNSNLVYSFLLLLLFDVTQAISGPGICSTWDNNHYHTFDGTSFTYDGTCSYALAIDCRPGSDDFAIHVENDDSCDTRNATTCKRAVSMYVNDIEYKISHHSVVTIDGKDGVNLPYLKNGVSVSKHADYIFIEAWNGKVIVKFDGNRSIYVTLDSSFKNATCGLCGSYNDNPLDDFMLPLEGQQTKSVNEFGNAWAKPKPGKTCAPVTKTHVSKCSAVSTPIQFVAQHKCKALLDNPEFRKCMDVVDPAPFYEKCKEDMCACNAVDSCLCDVFEQYTRKCAHNGIVMNWRTYDLCPKNCSHNKMFMECGPACTYSCDYGHGSTSICKEACVDGCHCPPHTALLDDRCIPVGECPCEHNGERHDHGATVQMGCNNCSCMGGKWNCDKMECDAVASVYGNGHFTTFDGKSYHFPGTCRYIFTKILEADWFSVAIDRKSCTNRNCHMSVHIGYKGNQITMQNEDSVFDILVNRKRIVLPFVSDRGFKITSESSIFVRMDTNDNIVIHWDGQTRLYVRVPHTLRGTLIGMAGNFNGKTIDEFVTPLGDVTHSVTDFGNSWMFSDTNCTLVSTDYRMTSCESNHQVAKYAEEKCQILMSSTFSACHMSVDPLTYFSNCKEDLCGCNGRQDCLCAVLAAYSRACALEGKAVSEWRNVSGCGETCSAGRVFTECGSKCVRSCSDVHTPNPECEEGCLEGCFCPEGKVIDEMTNMCVEKNKCGCQYGNETMTEGSSVNEGCKKCVCSNGTVECSEKDCTRNTTCSGGKIYTTCIPSCQATCKTQELNCDAVPTSCVSGCTCPDGLVEHNGVCIEKTKCSCYHNSKMYAEGMTISKDCNTCECSKGKWNCTENPCSATCSVFGDPHYKSFDGKMFDYQGKCEHVMLTDICPNYSNKEEHIRVVVNTAACGSQGVTCTREVVAIIHGTTFKMTRGKEKITISASDVVEDRDHYKVFQHAGSYVHVVTDYGVSLLWDNGTRLYISVDPRLNSKVCGLCGTFDGNEANDFITYQGDISGNAIQFGDSWRVDNSCPLTKAVPDTCKERPHRVDPSKRECAIIKSDTFKACHNFVDPSPYYDKCVFDACGCDTVGDCDCLCDAIAAYSKECLDEGFAVDWRKGHHICEKQRCCPPKMKFTPKGSACPKTCKYPEGDPTCPLKYVDGCQCPAGMVQNMDKLGNVECIKPEECNVCVLDGRTFAEGEKITIECQSCECINNTMQCSGSKCSTTTPQPTTTTPQPTTTSTQSTTMSTTPETTTQPPTTTPPGKSCVYNDGVKNVTLPVGAVVVVNECTNKTCVLDDVTGSPEIELVVTECDEKCEADCDTPNTRRSILVKVPGKCCRQCKHVDEICKMPGFLPCNATQCVPKEWFCDGRQDCPSGRDEACCPTLPPTTTSMPTISTTTEKPCEPPKIRTTCAPLCEEKCHSLGPCDTVLGVDMCIPGCQCPNGTIWNGTFCVPPNECTCRDENGVIRTPTDIWKDPRQNCSECRCLNNKIHCSPKKCPTLTCPVQKVDPGKCCPTCQIVTTTAPPTTTSQPCDCSRTVPVGVSDSRIPDKSMTSDSVLVNKPGTSKHTGPEQARLNNQPSENGAGAWEPKDEEGCLDVAFNKVEHVKLIKTQGSPAEHKYVTQYFVFYTVDEKHWEYLLPNTGELFSGNRDSNTIRAHEIDVKAIAFRLCPANDHTVGDPSPALRVEFYVCPCGPTQRPSTTVTTTPSTTSSTTEESTTPSTTSSTTEESTTLSTTSSTTEESTTPSTTSSTTEESTTPSTTLSTTEESTTPSTTSSTTEESTTPSTTSSTTEESTTPSTTSSTTEESTTQSTTSSTTEQTTTGRVTEILTEPRRTTSEIPLVLTTTEEPETTVATTIAGPCDCRTLKPIGVSDGRIPDKNMTTNSIRVNAPGTAAHTGPAEARLNNKPSETGNGAWEPKDSEAHLDIHFRKVENIKEIRTQGHPVKNKYARRFFLFASMDGKTFEIVTDASGEAIFEGNIDGNTIKSNALNFKAKAVRIVPVNDVSLGEPYPALRVELYSCPCKNETTPAPPTTTASTTTSTSTTEESTTASTTQSTTEETTTPSTTSSTTEESTTASTTKSTNEETTTLFTTPSTTSSTTEESTTASTTQSTTEETTTPSTTPSTTSSTTEESTTASTTQSTTEETTTPSTTSSTTEESTTASTTQSTTKESTTPSTTPSTTSSTTEESTTASTTQSTTEETTTPSTTPSTTSSTTEESTTASTTQSTTEETTTPSTTSSTTEESTTSSTTQSTTEETTTPSTTPSTTSSTTEESTTASTTQSTTEETTTPSTTPSTTTQSTTEETTTPSTTPSTTSSTTEESTTASTTQSTTEETTTPSTTPSTTSSTTEESTTASTTQSTTEETTTASTTSSTSTSTTATTTEGPCDCSTLKPLGVSDGRIADENMLSDSIKVNQPGTPEHTGPDQARLNNEPSENGVGAWVPDDEEGYLEIRFNKLESLKEIRTQGHPTLGTFTRNYFLFYTADGENWDTVKNADGELFFSGNADGSSTKINEISTKAIAVRIFPANDGFEAALRVEFYGCPCEETSTPSITTTMRVSSIEVETTAPVKTTPQMATTTAKPACPGDQIYKNCSHTMKCDGRKMCGSEEFTREGCCCPDGLHQLGDRCVKKEECPCLNDGVVQEEGKIWFPNQYEICRCRAGKQECTLSCPATFECLEHQKSIYVQPAVDGVCCKCVSDCQYCKVNHKYVPVNSTWVVSMTSDRCVTGKCTLDDDEECAIVEKDTTICEKACPENMKRAGLESDCCRCICDEDSCDVKSSAGCTEGEQYVKEDEECCGRCIQLPTTTQSTTTGHSSPRYTPTTQEFTGSTTSSTSTTSKPFSGETTSRGTFPTFPPMTTSSTTESTSSTTESTSSTTASTTSSTTEESTTSTTQEPSTTSSTTEESTTSTTSTTQEPSTTTSTTEESTTSTTQEPSTRTSTTERSTTSTTQEPSTTSSTTEETTTSTTTAATTTEKSTTITTQEPSTTSTTISTTEKSCDCTTPVPVGVSDGSIPDTQMITNSILVNKSGSPEHTGPEQARLNAVPSARGAGAWEPYDAEGYLEIQFNKLEQLKKIETQGSPVDRKYISRYFLFYTVDGEEWTSAVHNSGDDIFSGNVDGTSIVSHDINFKAKAVRIFPANDPSIGDPSVALRVEFYVCPCGPSTEEPSITTATTGKVTEILTEEVTTQPQLASTTESTTTEETTTEGTTTEATTTQSTTTSTTTPSPTPKSPCVVKHTEQYIKNGHCTSASKVRVASCTGLCESSSTFSSTSPFYMQQCRCCKPVAFEEVSVRMVCLKNKYTTLRVPIIRHCVCNACHEYKPTALPPTTEAPVGSGSGSESGGGSGEGSGEESGEGEGSGAEGTPSAASKPKRSLSDLFYKFFIGESK